ncbi:membrane protein [Thalassotalea insulae]|uniref:Membrane protein n=1 Tax=Thalassotalea insulae TaxID=2056778 RepID=A0ABQ6GNA0_9GAMM|nr:EamA family transporter [Thalassotalea insulae]GLX77039.1 membrane protein [Thalassotalea insulae]
MSLKDNIIGLLIIFIWGFNFVVIAWGVKDLPPLLMGAERFLLVAVLGSLFVKKPSIPWKWMAFYALTLCFGQFAFLFSAIAFGMPAGLASLVLQSQAVFTLIFSALFLKESIKLYQVITIVCAGIGLWLIGVTGVQSDMTGIGFALTIAAAIAWAAGNIVNRVINQRGYQANLGLVVWSSWVAFIPFLIASYLVEGPETIVASIINIQLNSMLVILYLAFAASILGYSLWSYLLTHYPAGQVAPLTLGVPVVGIICASVFLQEVISQQQFLGIFCVMLGLAVNALGNRWHRKLNAKKV